MNQSFPFSVTDIQKQFGTSVYPDSFVVHNETAFWLEKTDMDKHLLVLAKSSSPIFTTFNGEPRAFQNEYSIKRCTCTHANSSALRNALPWLKPVPLGLDTSAGFGDRLGLATPGHTSALKNILSEAPRASRKIVPIFAQQSIREMERSCRSPEDVINDATWGCFQAGWNDKLGADADHLKTTDDIDVCANAGFTLFTIDPGEYVDKEADTAEPSTLQQKMNALPWSDLKSSIRDLEKTYIGKTFDLENQSLEIKKPDLIRAAVKYGRAVAHVAKMASHIQAKNFPCEIEVSVDETETPTSMTEHIYIASELKRLGVKFISLAPRYVGRFEKGIDYIGNLKEIEENLAGHAAIARALGPYKLSMHSGSDKFSVYPLISKAAKGLVHLKTAGTSYVEALRVIAKVDPVQFRQISAFAIKRYPEDRASYHVSAELSKIPDLSSLADEQLPDLLDDRHVRQILHVTYGSVLKQSGAQLKLALQTHEDAYYKTLEQHFHRHLQPFLL